MSDRVVAPGGRKATGSLAGVVTVLSSGSELLDALRRNGRSRGGLIALALPGSCSVVALATPDGSYVLNGPDPVAALRLVEAELRPRWVWWDCRTAEILIRQGLRVATCWDLAGVHRLLFGGWRAEPATIWAVLHRLSTDALPTMGQLGLLDSPGDEGMDPEDPVRPDGHLRPEWASGGWQDSPGRLAKWAGLGLSVCGLQESKLAGLREPNGAAGTARSESAAELLCVELTADGLPLDVVRAEEIIGALIGPRPRDHAEETAARQRRDNVVLGLAPMRSGVDLRNPADVKSMLAGLGIDVSNTRAHRLEPFRDTHPLVEALLNWRKAERVATTYGYAWLDEHVAADGRLRGAWTACDGAAGRMTASAGLHNLPSEMRAAVVAESGHVFVHADLGQIEPRVLAAVSGDRALAEATQADDMYAPVAERLRVERAVAKIAVLAAMYGQTSGAAGEALRGMESAYPVAMEFLRNADRSGQNGRDVRTYGGRLVRLGFGDATGNDGVERNVVAGRGRYARNAVVQGAAAELFKAWAVTVRGRIVGLGGQIVLCLHDELLLHVPESSAVEAAAVLEDSLHAAAIRWMPHGVVRYVAKANVIRCWADAKG